MSTSFSVEALVRGMAPIDVILQHVSSETKLIPVIAHLWESPTGPSRYYLSCLIRRYVQQLEDEDKHCDDDTLMELIRQSCNASITTTDPEESCHQSFHLVNHNQPLLQIRVYPHHNNVALRLWPAAAALAEYILSEPSLFAPHDVVLETGAGVGLTGIVMAAATPVRKIVLTDYTATAVDNLRHNVQLNQRVVLGQDHNIVTGFLDWETFDHVVEKEDDYVHQTFYYDATVLMAADVVYDVAAIPALVRMVHCFLRVKSQRRAIFATTLRNQDTFSLFETYLLQDDGVICDYHETVDELPQTFPVYFVQRRHDIRICSMRLSTEDASLS